MKLYFILIACVIAILGTACYDEKDTIAELITPTGKGFYPVSANTFVDLANGLSLANRVYTQNTNVSFELQYWSGDPIQEVNLYSTVGAGARTKVFGKPYAEIAAYSSIKSADTLIFTLKMPVVAAETNVKLEVEIVNQNTLSLLRTVTIKSRP
jgi:hypothetical protein